METTLAPTNLPWRIRRATPDDLGFAAESASRLLVGTAPWRDRDALLATFRAWLVEAIMASTEQQGDKAAFIAETPGGIPLGIITVGTSAHFTGEPQVEIGELAVTAAAEGKGVGSALLQAAEAWAHEQGYHVLTLGTGAANAHARAFYAHHGFREEDIRLTKVM